MLRSAATRGRNRSVRLELEARRLGHDEAVAREVERVLGTAGVPMLPPTSTGRTWARQELAGQRGRGGLAVGAGDRDDLGLHRPPRQLELADDGHAAGAHRGRARAADGTPGLTTTSSAPAKAASGWPPVHERAAARSSARRVRGEPLGGLRRRRRARGRPGAACSRAGRHAAPAPARPRRRSAGERRRNGRACARRPPLTPRSPRAPGRPVCSETRSMAISSSASPELQGGQRQERQHERQDPEADDDLGLCPAASSRSGGGAAPSGRPACRSA